MRYNNRMAYRAFRKGNYVHVLKRGGRRQPIVADDHDRWRFVKLLRYFNTSYRHSNWERSVEAAGSRGYHMPWPNNWPDQDALVDIQAFCLLDNHFHLLVKVKGKRGVSTFIERVCKSMSTHYNRRHGGGGSLFGGPYKSRVVYSDKYLRHLIPYIVFKNTLELHSEGLNFGHSNFSDAYKWVMQHDFSNANDFIADDDSTAVTNLDELMLNYFASEVEFKKAARECLQRNRLSPGSQQLLLEKF
jgi:hypothetical protein